MPFGCGNSIPFQVGGSPTRFETVYASMKRIVGQNGYSTDDENEIEALWRQSKVDGLVILSTFDERATMQTFPQLATDYLSVFEEILGIQTDSNLSDQERRDIIIPDYTGTPEAWTSGLMKSLLRIDPLISVIYRPWRNSGTCHLGRWFEPFDGTDYYDQYSSNKQTKWPNVSDMHSVIVKFDIGSGSVPNLDQRRKTIRIQEFLNEICPSWVDFHIIYSTGFTLDLSRLDATGFGS